MVEWASDRKIRFFLPIEKIFVPWHRELITEINAKR